MLLQLAQPVLHLQVKPIPDRGQPLLSCSFALPIAYLCCILGVAPIYHTRGSFSMNIMHLDVLACLVCN